MVKKPAPTEAELAQQLAEEMKADGWSIYPEAVIPGFSGRPDIVARRRNLIHVIECKRTLSLKVLEQAAEWLNPDRSMKAGMPHLISVAVPYNKLGRSWLIERFLKENRIGLLSVYAYGGDRVLGVPQYREVIPPRLQPLARVYGSALADHLHEDMKGAVPGSRGGETVFMTPFKRTLERVKAFMADGEAHHLDPVIAAVNAAGGHHYDSDTAAKSALTSFMDGSKEFERARRYGPWFIYLPAKAGGSP